LQIKNLELIKVIAVAQYWLKNQIETVIVKSSDSLNERLEIHISELENHILGLPLDTGLWRLWH
jgi:hypothetical protein